MINKTNEIKQKSADLALALSANERYLKESLEQKYQKESYYRSNLSDYREVLSKKANYQQQLKNSEKAVCKLSDELKSKLKRVEVLSKNQMGLQEKLKAYEEQFVQYQTYSEKNSLLELQNQELLEKLSLYSTDYQPQPIKGTQKYKLTSKDKETELYKEAKRHIMLEDYLVNIREQIAEKDNQIFYNKQLVTDLNNAIEKIKRENFTEQMEIEKIGKKYQVVQEANQKTRIKYNNMQEQAGILDNPLSPIKFENNQELMQAKQEDLFNQLSLDQQMLSDANSRDNNKLQTVKDNM